MPASENHFDETATYCGITHTLTEWAEIYGVKASLLYRRIHDYGYSFEEAVTLKHEKRERIITYKGESRNLREWSEALKIPYNTLRSRLNNLHWTVEKAFETPYESFYWNRKGGKDDQ